MNNDESAVTITRQGEPEQRLKSQVQEIIAAQNLDGQRLLINAIATEIKVSVLDFAAAIVYLNQRSQDKALSEKASSRNFGENRSERLLNQPSIKLVRYRLDLGIRHQVALDEIKKVLVEESGVDVKNISNVRIMESYTLIDLPDEMPQEIFHHLKTIEINGQMLDIRRVKPRNKKRNNRRHGHIRKGTSPSTKEVSQ